MLVQPIESPAARQQRPQSSPQLHLTKPSPHPRTRQRNHNQRDRVPMRPKLRPAIPRNNRSSNTHDKSDKARHHRMPHRPVRSEPRRNITSRHPKHSAISRSQRQRPIAHRLSPRRKHTSLMQHNIGGESQRDSRHHPCNHSPNTSPDISLNCRHEATPSASSIGNTASSRSYPAAIPFSIGVFNTASRTSRDA